MFRANPGTSLSGSASFSLLPFGSLQTSPVSGASAKCLEGGWWHPNSLGTSTLPQNMESCLAIMCPMDKGCRAQAGDTSTGFTPDEDHFFQLHFGYSSHAQVLLLQRYLLLLPLPAFSGSPQDPSRLHSSPQGTWPSYRDPSPRITGGMLPSAGTGAALQRGEPAGHGPAGKQRERRSPGSQHIRPFKF